MARQREFNLDEVIDKAMHLFWAQGYEATSIRDLKTATGISSSSMYEAFGDKRGLFLAALERFCGLEQARIEQMAQAAESPQRFIHHLFLTLEGAAPPPAAAPAAMPSAAPAAMPSAAPAAMPSAAPAAMPSAAPGSLALNAMIEFSTRDAEVTRLLLAHYLRLASIIADVLAAGQQQGTVSSQEVPLNLAYTLLSSLHGLAMITSVKPDFASVSAITSIIVKLLDT